MCVWACVKARAKKFVVASVQAHVCILFGWISSSSSRSRTHNEICVDTCVVRSVSMGLDRCVDMCIDMIADTWIDIRVDTCMDMCGKGYGLV